MEKKSYGILMKRHKVSENICIYHPIYLITGRDTGQDFEDEMGYFYTYATDTEAFCLQENDLSVAYIVSEEELQRQYDGVPLSEAKMGYFSSINEYIHVGYYMDIEDEIIIKSYNAEVLLEQLLSKDECTSTKSCSEQSQGEGIPFLRIEREKNVGESASTSLVVEELIPIPAPDFKKMLDIREDGKLRSILQNMYEQFQNGILPVTIGMDESEIYPTLENQEITGKKIVSFFKDICNKMITASSMKQISQLETNFKNGFTAVVLILDTHANNEIAASAAEEIFYRIMDEIAVITACRNIVRVKTDIANVLKTETEEVARAATIYDEYDAKFEKDMEDRESQSSKKIFSLRKVNAKKLKEFFDRRIAGQEAAKRAVISAVTMNMLSENPDDRTSCFLVGPPGSGKTLIAKTLGEFLNIPCEIVDTTQLTSPGYIGGNIEDFLARLITKAGGDLEKAENGIVVFDELDKKGSDKKSDIAGQGALNSLLPFFQGATYQVPKGKDKVEFNTSRLTIFATGACTDVAKAKLQKEGLDHYKKTKIGFLADVSSKQLEEDFVYPQLEPEDFVKYGGMTDEIIGRITTICQLSGHTVETLKFILTDIETSALLLQQKALAKIGISLRWTEDYLEAIAHKAIQLKTGARSLKATVEKSIMEARWEVLMNPDKYSGILLTAECVENPLKCKLIDQKGREITVEEVSVEEPSLNQKVKKASSMQQNI